MIIDGQVYRDEPHPKWCMCDECVPEDPEKKVFAEAIDRFLKMEDE